MAETGSCDEELKAAFPSIVQDGAAQGKFSHFLVPKDLVPAITHYLHTQSSLHGRLTLLWAIDNRPVRDAYGLHYLFTLETSHRWVMLSTELAGDDRLFPSITPHIHAAKWYEREIRDMFGLIPQGHPDLRRLIRHEHWPKGTHPLKKDFPWTACWVDGKASIASAALKEKGCLKYRWGQSMPGSSSQAIFDFLWQASPLCNSSCTISGNIEGSKNYSNNKN